MPSDAPRPPLQRMVAFLDRHAALRRRVAAPLAVFCLAAAYHGWIEFQTPMMLEIDGYYHIKLAEMYATGECSIFGGDFPWMQFSSLNRLRHDWQLLYHIALIPFCAFDLMTGAKLSAVVFAAGLITTIYILLRRMRVPWPWFFAVLANLAAPSLLWRMHLPRPTTFFLIPFLFLVWALAEKRPKAVFWLSLISMLTYNVPHNYLALGGIACLLIMLNEKTIPWRLMLALGLGLLAGIVLHPGFWHWGSGGFFSLDHGTFQLWKQIQGSVDTSLNEDCVTVAGDVLRMRLGRELLPLNGRAIRAEFAIPLLFAFGSLSLLAFRPRSIPLAGQLFLALGAVYFALFLDSMRFMEYWAPFAVLGGAAVMAECLRGLPFIGVEPAAPTAGLLRFSKTLERAAGVGFAIQGLVLLVGFSPKDVETWLPAALAGIALLGRSLLSMLPPSFEAAAAFPRRPLAVGALFALGGIALGAGLAYSNHRRGWDMATNTHDRFGVRYEGAMKTLKNISQPGDIVYHTDWDDFPALYFYNPKCRYLVGLDPYFMYLYDPMRFRTWTKTSHGEYSVEDTEKNIRSFGARWVYSSREDNWNPLIDKLKRSGRFPVVYEDPYSVLFRMPGD